MSFIRNQQNYQQQDVSASSELDYLIEYQSNVLPIEVKPGTSGSLKSLHVFVANKKTAIVVRFDTNLGIW